MVQFVVTDVFTFKAKVFVTAPTEDGKKSTFQVWGKFKVQESDETENLLKDLQEKVARGQSTLDLEMETLKNVLTGWEDFVNEDKSAFEFTDANRDRLLNVPFIRVAFWRAYTDAISGQAKRGN